MRRCDTPLLLAATGCAVALAEARGWSAATVTGVFYGLKAVLDGRAGDGPVLLSQVRQRVRPRSHSSATRIAEVLAEAGLLHDDTTAAIRTWIDRRTGELPPGSAAASAPGWWYFWTATAAAAPGSPTTLRVHFGMLRPFVERWAARRGHLREITYDDVDTILEAAAQSPALRRHHRAALAVPVRQKTQTDVRRPPGTLSSRAPGAPAADDRRTDPGRPAGGRRSRPRLASPWRPCTPPAPRASTNSPWTTSTCPRAHHHRRAPPAPGRAHPPGAAGLARIPARHLAGPANRHVLISRISALGAGPVAPDYLGGTSCAASASSASGATASSRKPWPPGPTLCT